MTQTATPTRKGKGTYVPRDGDVAVRVRCSKQIHTVVARPRKRNRPKVFWSEGRYSTGRWVRRVFGTYDLILVDHTKEDFTILAMGEYGTRNKSVDEIKCPCLRVKAAWDQYDKLNGARDGPRKYLPDKLRDVREKCIIAAKGRVQSRHRGHHRGVTESHRPGPNCYTRENPAPVDRNELLEIHINKLVTRAGPTPRIDVRLTKKHGQIDLHSYSSEVCRVGREEWAFRHVLLKLPLTVGGRQVAWAATPAGRPADATQCLVGVWGARGVYLEPHLGNRRPGGKWQFQRVGYAGDEHSDFINPVRYAEKSK